MKYYLTTLFWILYQPVYSQFNDSIAQYPGKELSIYKDSSRRIIRDIKFRFVELPNIKKGLELTIATILTRENLHYMIPLDIIQFNAKDDTLKLYFQVKDTIGIAGMNSAPEHIHWYFYWRAFTELSEKEINFLSNHEVLSIQILPQSPSEYITRQIKRPKELQELFIQK